MARTLGKCGTCRFFYPMSIYSFMETGECRRHAPSAATYRWPIVKTGEGCGDYEKGTNKQQEYMEMTNAAGSRG
jgi:hypothetical protein